MSSQLIVSVSGLRGVVGETLTPEVAMRYVAAFVATQNARGAFVVTRDSRQSGEMFSQVIAATLMALGCDVIDGGVAATPTTGILVRRHNAVGGIQISASHNPSEYNGIKLFSSDGRVIPATVGTSVLSHYHSPESLINKWATHDKLGKLTIEPTPFAAHLDAVLASVDVEAIRQRRFRVLLDANRGAGGAPGRQLLTSLGCDVTILGETPDGLFEHTPEPIEQNLTSVAAHVAAAQHTNPYDVAFCQDPDADRLALIDSTGRYLGEEVTVPLCVDRVLSQRGSGCIVINCATSRMTELVAKRHDAKVVRSAVGEANVVDAMLAHSAIFGGEGNGGPIDPKIGLVRDSFVGMAIVLDALAASEKTLTALAASLPQSAMIKDKITLQPERIAVAIDNIAANLGRGARVSRLDGLRLDWDDSWVLLRASNTEPIVRIIAEADSVAAAERLCRECRECVKELM